MSDPLIQDPAETIRVLREQVDRLKLVCARHIVAIGGTASPASRVEFFEGLADCVELYVSRADERYAKLATRMAAQEGGES